MLGSDFCCSLVQGLGFGGWVKGVEFGIHGLVSRV